LKTLADIGPKIEVASV